MLFGQAERLASSEPLGGGGNNKKRNNSETHVQFAQMCRLFCHRLVTQSTAPLTSGSFVDIVNQALKNGQIHNFIWGTLAQFSVLGRRPREPVCSGVFGAVVTFALSHAYLVTSGLFTF